MNSVRVNICYARQLLAGNMDDDIYMSVRADDEVAPAGMGHNNGTHGNSADLKT